jgi:hypothetical protein
MESNQKARFVYSQHVTGQPVALLIAIVAAITITALAF